MSLGIPELLLILVIVLLLFGTTKLKSLGSDLGSAIRGFKKELGSDEGAKLEADIKTDLKADTGSRVDDVHKVEANKK